MSDEEIIATWITWNDPSMEGNYEIWWTVSLCPKPLTLDRLWEVEARLTQGQWQQYEQWLNANCLEWPSGKPNWWAIHADATQKIVALAAVLRPLVEGGKL